MTKLPKNPFENYEEWTPWLEGDKLYWQAKQSGWKQYQQQYLKNNNNFFMSFKQQYINFAHLITKNAIAATVIMLIALTTVGASAAELFAPDQYKPSNLFSNKQETKTQITNFEECKKAGGQIMESYPEQCSLEGKTFTRELTEEEKNAQIKPLFADENHDVVVIDECDLAVRFAKNITVDGQNYTRKIDYSKEKLSLINLNQNVMDEPSGMDITCSNQKSQDEELYDLSPSQKTKQEVCNILNLTEASCDKIETFQEYSMTKHYSPNRNILFKFKANNKEYRISLGYVNPEKQGLENIQIQFNSLAPSTPSIKLTEQKAVQNNVKPLVADGEHDVVVIEECDLAVTFKKGQQFYKNANVPAGIFTKSTGLKDSDNFEVGYAGFSVSMSEMSPEISMSVLCMPGKYDFQEANPVRDISKDSAILRKSKTNIQDIKKYGIELKNLPENLVVKQANGDIPCCGLNNEGALYITFENNDNTVLIRYSNFSNNHENLFEILAQPNSLAPSTPSVKLETSTENKTNQKSYTNQYFPNLKINYDESWKFETKTKPQVVYKNLLERDITLTKDGSTLNISLSPIIVPSGCGGYTDGTFQEIKIDDNHYRINDTYLKRYVYSRGKDPDCRLQNQLKTTIKVKDVQYSDSGWKQGYEDFHKGQNSETVIYLYFISLKTNKDAHIKEVDEIIKSSVLR